MNTFVFIASILFGASLLSGGLVIVAAMMSSRASERLAEKYPAIHGEQSQSTTDSTSRTGTNSSGNGSSGNGSSGNGNGSSGDSDGSARDKAQHRSTVRHVVAR